MAPTIFFERCPWCPCDGQKLKASVIPFPARQFSVSPFIALPKPRCFGECQSAKQEMTACPCWRRKRDTLGQKVQHQKGCQNNLQAEWLLSIPEGPNHRSSATSRNWCSRRLHSRCISKHGILVHKMHRPFICHALHLALRHQRSIPRDRSTERRTRQKPRRGDLTHGWSLRKPRLLPAKKKWPSNHSIWIGITSCFTTFQVGLIS